MFYVSKIAQTNRVQLCVGFPRAWLQSRLGKAMVHVHQVGIFFKNIEEILGKEIEKTNFFRKVMRKQGKEPVQSNKQDKVYIEIHIITIDLFHILLPQGKGLQPVEEEEATLRDRTPRC